MIKKILMFVFMAILVGILIWLPPLLGFNASLFSWGSNLFWGVISLVIAGLVYIFVIRPLMNR